MHNIGDLLNSLTAATIKSWAAFPRAIEHFGRAPQTDVVYCPDGLLDELIAAVQNAPDPALRRIVFTPSADVPPGIMCFRVFWPDDFPERGMVGAFSTLATIDTRICAAMVDRVVGPVRRVAPTHEAPNEVQ